MLHVFVIAVGKCRERYFADACAEYAKRLSAFCKLTVAEVDEYKLPANPSEAEIQKCLEAEGKSILAKIPPKAAVFSLCVEGGQLSSPQLAQKMASISATEPCIAFIIGGSHGLSEEIKAVSRERISLSAMTLPHQLARVVLLEQIYRAFAIGANLKYHK